MQLLRLLEAVLAGISILAILLLLFIVIEKFRFASGKKMFTDKCIDYLEEVHNLTVPERDEKVEVREYYLSDKVKIMELFFHEKSCEKNPVEKIRGETNG